MLLNRCYPQELWGFLLDKLLKSEFLCEYFEEVWTIPGHLCLYVLCEVCQEYSECRGEPQSPASLCSCWRRSQLKPTSTAFKMMLFCKWCQELAGLQQARRWLQVSSQHPAVPKTVGSAGGFWALCFRRAAVALWLPSETSSLLRACRAHSSWLFMPLTVPPACSIPSVVIQMHPCACLISQGKGEEFQNFFCGFIMSRKVEN